MSAEKTGWVRAASRRDVTEGEVLSVEVAGHSIALYDVDGASSRPTIFALTPMLACLTAGSKAR